MLGRIILVSNFCLAVSVCLLSLSLPPPPFLSHAPLSLVLDMEVNHKSQLLTSANISSFLISPTICRRRRGDGILFLCLWPQYLSDCVTRDTFMEKTSMTSIFACLCHPRDLACKWPRLMESGSHFGVGWRFWNTAGPRRSHGEGEH